MEEILHQLIFGLHPGRLTRNLPIPRLERKMILQTSMIMFHVNLQGCIPFFAGFHRIEVGQRPMNPHHQRPYLFGKGEAPQAHRKKPNHPRFSGHENSGNTSFPSRQKSTLCLNAYFPKETRTLPLRKSVYHQQIPKNCWIFFFVVFDFQFFSQICPPYWSIFVPKDKIQLTFLWPGRTKKTKCWLLMETLRFHFLKKQK